MKGIGKIFESTIGGLIFSLLSGCAYFIIILGFILTNTTSGGGLLEFFFFPAVVCGIALVLLKTIRRLGEEEQFRKINIICWIHVFLFLISLVFLADILI